MALLSVVLDRDGPQPLSWQLSRQISEHIRSGRLPSGSRLASTRRLASELGVSRTVTFSAYEQLASEGYIEGRRGSGQYVRSLHWELEGPRIAPPIHPPVPGEPDAAQAGRPFDPSSQPSDMFPAAIWARLLSRSWRRENREAQASGMWGGLPSLREAVALYAFSLRGIPCDAGQVFITAGAADSLHLIAGALAPEETQRLAGAWVEDPGHLTTQAVLRARGVRVIPVPVDQEGLDVAAGRRLAESARFALVTPSRQFPLGMPMSLTRRLALVRWSLESGAVLIEDDYDTELRFAGRPIPSLLSLDRDVQALSLGSFSKLTFPGLRLSYVIGPRPLIRLLEEARRKTGAPVATTAQLAFATMLETGGFARHLRHLRKEVSDRRGALVSALRDRLGDRLEILPQEVGMHLAVTLASGEPDDVFLSRAGATRGLRLNPLSAHYQNAPKRSGLVLGYSAWSKEQLTSAMDDLVKAVAAT